MRPIWKGAISFGLVAIPVSLYSGTEKRDIRFTYLHSKCMTPVRYAKICPSCNVEVSHDEICYGYQYEPGKFVVVSDDDFEVLPHQSIKSIDILEFVPQRQIPLILYDRTYYLGTSGIGSKAYLLLKGAMAETGRVAVANVTLRTRQTLAVVRNYGDVLAMSLLRYSDEIRETKQIADEMGERPVTGPSELDASISLIEALRSSFDPAEPEFSDQRRLAMVKRLDELVQEERSKNAVGRDDAQTPSEQAIDLMAALRASLKSLNVNSEAVERVRETKAKRTKKKKPPAAIS